MGTQPQTTLSLDWSAAATNATIPSPTPYVAPTYTTVANFTATPVQTGIPTSCANYYLAQADDNCDTVLAQYGYVTEEQFLAWNPALAGNCLGLWVGYYYCVGVDDGDAADLPLPPTVTATPSPTGDGTVASCAAWYMTTVDDTCDDIAEIFGSFSTADFISWNPSVWSSCGNIQQNTYYCVGIPGTPTSRTATILPGTSTTTSIASVTTTSSAAVTTPSPFRPGVSKTNPRLPSPVFLATFCSSSNPF